MSSQYFGVVVVSVGGTNLVYFEYLRRYVRFRFIGACPLFHVHLEFASVPMSNNHPAHNGVILLHQVEIISPNVFKNSIKPCMPYEASPFVPSTATCTMSLTACANKTNF